MRLYDAHNHLQDPRLDGCRHEAVDLCKEQGLARMVVNGSCEEDWPQVLALAREHACVLPSFGVHPWYVKHLSNDWQKHLVAHLDQVPSALGEIGLDRWIQDYDLPRQEKVFRWQLRLAAERNLPVTIHCLQAWGRLEELLRAGPRPARGFLLHSYGGPAEMVHGLAGLGAYFSISGYFAHDRKARQREVFRQVPRDRILVETDAPDMWPPDAWNEHPLKDPLTGKACNHPANLASVYRFAAALLEMSLPEFAGQVESNFIRLFG